MFDTVREYTAKLTCITASTVDSNGNTVIGTTNKTDLFKCSRKMSTVNSKLTSSNLENQSRFQLMADIITTLPTNTSFKVVFQNETFDVIDIKVREFINDMVIYVR